MKAGESDLALPAKVLNRKSHAEGQMTKLQIQSIFQSYFPPRQSVPVPNKNLANFYKSYFNGAYFLFMSPFRLKLTQRKNSRESNNNNNEGDDDDGLPSVQFTSVSWLPQKVLCIFLLFLHLFWMAKDLRASLPKDAKNPSMYFLMIHTVVSCSWKFSTLKYFWFNREAFVKLLNFVIDPENCVPVSSSTKSSKSNPDSGSSSKLGGLFRGSNNLLVYFILFIYSGVGVGYWLAGKGVLSFSSNKIENWSFAWWWGTMKDTGQVLFFAKDRVNSNSTMGTFLGVLAVGSAYHRRVLPLYCYYFGMVTVLTLRSSVTAFTSTFINACSDIGVGRESEGDIFKITSNGSKHIVINMKGKEEDPESDIPSWTFTRKQYWALKTLANLINQSFGTCFTLYLLKSIVYYAITFDEVFVDATPKWSKIFLLGVYFCNACFVLYFSADICYKMSKFKEWLSIQTNQQCMSSDELQVILNEVDSNIVAIRGGNVFPITHSLVANIIGVTVTYFIICVQT